MDRKTARENAFKLIYEFLIVDEVNNLAFEEITLDCDKSSLEYITNIYNGVKSQYNVMSNAIANLANNYQLQRLYKVDLAILLLATYEILYVSDIPNAVSCNEAVELAKAYSTKNSPNYINGILASVVKTQAQILADINNSTNGDN